MVVEVTVCGFRWITNRVLFGFFIKENRILEYNMDSKNNAVL
jgi:hypothetical protein